MSIYLNSHLELEFHAGDCVSEFGLHQLVDVLVQVASRNFSVSADHCLQQRIMDEDVLVLSLEKKRFKTVNYTEGDKRG